VPIVAKAIHWTLLTSRPPHVHLGMTQPGEYLAAISDCHGGLFKCQKKLDFGFFVMEELSTRTETIVTGFVVISPLAGKSVTRTSHTPWQSSRFGRATGFSNSDCGGQRGGD